MRPLFTASTLGALCITMLITTGCGEQEPTEEASGAVSEKASSPADLLVGTWLVDKDATARSLVPDATPEMLDMADLFDATFTFGAGGTLAMNMRINREITNKSGSYEVIEEEENSCLLSLTTDGGQSTQTATAVFSNDDYLTITTLAEDGPPPMMFTRVE